jgi:starch-binding outer membrane protein, SusD/RagB family
MKKSFLKYSVFGLMLLIGLGGCQSEYLNPSSVSENNVVNDVNGLIALCNGLQYRLTVGRASPGYGVATASGLSAKGLRVLNSGNADEDFLEKGGLNVGNGNSIVKNIWEQNNLVKTNADFVLDNLAVATDPNMKAALQAHASIMKALALGNLAMFFEKAPIVKAQKATFNTRQEVLTEAARLCESAASALNGVTIPAAFNARISGGIDYINTANALAARFYTMLGNSDKALETANKVDLTKKSQFTYDELSRNPVFETAFSNENVYQPIDLNFGLPTAIAPAAEDKRIDFYLKSRVVNTKGNLLGKGFSTANSSPLPIYLPGEITLIKAEASARKNDLTTAVTELNKVLTKKTDSWGLGADLKAYSGANTQADILTEIYRNRRIEMFMMGQELEDSRRFSRPGPGVAGAERTRNFYPYPLSERNNNTDNCPADPAN